MDSLRHRIIDTTEGRAILWPGLAVVINAGCGNIGVTEPFLHFGDIRTMIKRVGGRSRPQAVRPDWKAENADSDSEQYTLLIGVMQSIPLHGLQFSVSQGTP